MLGVVLGHGLGLPGTPSRAQPYPWVGLEVGDERLLGDIGGRGWFPPYPGRTD
jgi:hypothetical protein